MSSPFTGDEKCTICGREAVAIFVDVKTGFRFYRCQEHLAKWMAITRCLDEFGVENDR